MLDFGSCQYDGIAEIVSEHYTKVLDLKTVNEVEDYLKINLKLSKISIENMEVEEILKVSKNYLIESILELYDIPLDVSESIEMYHEGTLKDYVNEDDDEINEEAFDQIESIIKSETFENLIIQTRDAAWDLWGCLRTFSILLKFDCVVKIDEDEDIKLAAGALYIIWKFKIENPEVVFDGFST